MATSSKSKPQTEWEVSTEQLSARVPPHFPPVVDFKRAERVEFWDQMLYQDPHLRQALNFCISQALSLVGEYEHEDERLQSFIRQALGGMRNSLWAVQHWLLHAPYMGFALSEKIWRQARIEGRAAWVYDALIPIEPISVATDGIQIEKALGQPEEIIQWGQYGDGIHIPGAKVVHWAWEDRGDGYGQGHAQNLEGIFRLKQGVLESWGQGLRMRGQPPIYEVVPGIDITDPVTKKKTAYTEIIRQTWEKAKSGAVMIRPVPPGEEWRDGKLPRVEVLQGTGWTTEFENHVDYVNRSYFLGLGIPALLMMEAQHGTRAQSEVQSQAARLGALPIAEEFTETCLMRDLVRPLIEVNFGEQQDYGTFPCSVPLDSAFVAQLLQSLSAAGYTGLLVPKPVYDRAQLLLPDLLPVLDEQDYLGGEGEVT